MATILTQIQINGTTVSDYIFRYETEEAWGDSCTICELKALRSIISEGLSGTDLAAGMTVEIWDGWVTATDNKRFSGYIESFEPEGGIIKITAKDKIWDLVRKEATHTYDSGIDASAGVVSEIFEDLVTTYGGLSADATSIQDSGTTILITKFVCNHAGIFERCKKLSDVLGWQFYYRADTDLVYFESQGYNVNGTILTVGDNVMGIPKWDYDMAEMCNDLTIVGAYQEIETTESGQIGVTSGYTTSSITLNFTPISVKVYGDAANPPTTLRAGGIPGSTTTYFYSVDKPNKKILPYTSFTVNHFYEIRYSHAVPIPVHQINSSSITNYGTFSKTITYTDIRSITDAEERASNYLVKYSSPFLSTTLKVKPTSSDNYRIGDSIRIIDNISSPAVDTFLTITRLRKRWPADYIEMVVGDKSFRLAQWQASVEERLKRIFENELANQDIVTEIVTIDNTTLNPLRLTPRYRQIKTNGPTGTNCFILGHPVYAELGTSQLGDNDISAEADLFVQQYENVYTEDFIDADFEDTSGTAAWSTTGVLTFTGSQTALSTAIDKDNGTITSATMTITVNSGSANLTYYMTANGGSDWESVTNGVAHTFSDTGSDLRWKIVSSGNAEVESITIEGYH